FAIKIVTVACSFSIDRNSEGLISNWHFFVFIMNSTALNYLMFTFSWLACEHLISILFTSVLCLSYVIDKRLIHPKKREDIRSSCNNFCLFFRWASVSCFTNIIDKWGTINYFMAFSISYLWLTNWRKYTFCPGFC